VACGERRLERHCALTVRLGEADCSSRLLGAGGGSREDENGGREKGAQRG